jgi:hypothetical protein
MLISLFITWAFGYLVKIAIEIASTEKVSQIGVHVFHPNPLRFPRATPRRTGCANKGVATGRRDLNLCTFIFVFSQKLIKWIFGCCFSRRSLRGFGFHTTKHSTDFFSVPKKLLYTLFIRF